MAIIKQVSILTISICISTFFIMSTACSKARVSSIGLTSINQEDATATIKYTGLLNTPPDLLVKKAKGGQHKSIIQITMPKTVVWPKIEKKTSLGKSKFDTTLMAYQYDKDSSRFRVLLPYSVVGKERLVSMVLKKGKIMLNFPLIKNESKQTQNTASANFDETYLEQLLNDKKLDSMKEEAKKNIDTQKDIPPAQMREDNVKVSLSSEKLASEKNNNSMFSFAGYAGKFALFLGIVIALFFAVIHIFKKGVLKKGKLGFLNDTPVITVLSTTYLAPKKSLMLVKVHKQVFLIGSDEKGLHFLSEVNDLTSLIKDGEQSITGTNFDTSLNTANTNGKDFKLKDDVQLERAQNNNSNLENFISNVQAKEKEKEKEKIKFSDHLKDKVKGLKRLQ